MPQLRRLAITAEDPVKLAAFYQEVFELNQIGEAGGAVFLSDGTFNLALLPETGGTAAGLKALGFDSARLEPIRTQLARTANADHSVVERDANTGIEYEMHDPDGNLLGLRTPAFDVSSRQGPVPIRHIGLYTPDPQRLADFYCHVLHMKEPAKRRAYRTQSLRLSRQEQRRNANEGGEGRRAPRRGATGADSFCGVPRA